MLATVEIRRWHSKPLAVQITGKPSIMRIGEGLPTNHEQTGSKDIVVTLTYFLLTPNYLRIAVHRVFTGRTDVDSALDPGRR